MHDVFLRCGLQVAPQITVNGIVYDADEQVRASELLALDDDKSGVALRRRLVVSIAELLPHAIHLETQRFFGQRGRGKQVLLQLDGGASALRTRTSSVAGDVPRIVRPLTEADLLFKLGAAAGVRALYAAGRACGTAEFALGDHNRLTLTALHALTSTEQQQLGVQHTRQYVSPEPQRVAHRDTVQTAIQRLPQPDAESPAQSQRVMIGADPEFLLLNPDGHVISASRFLSDGHGVGADTVAINGTLRSPLAELRPAAAAHPLTLFHHIHHLLRQARELITDPSLRWLAGGMPARGFALGGHLHFSGVPFAPHLLRLLDSYVAFPLALIETPADHARRPQYGFLGDYKLQPHGFEYRTPPSWLVSPAATRAALALAYICAREPTCLTYVPACEETYIAAYYAADHVTLRQTTDPLLENLARTSLWQELSPLITPLFTAIHQHDTWHSDQDLRIKWNLL
jgi:hypothetical protein